ncbi:hypothetical protein [Paraburkholderia sp. 2C]
MEWVTVLRERGDDFASHAAACSYWLYEHAADFPELLDAWEKEQRVRTAVRRSVAALEMQRARVGYLVQTGIDAVDAKAVLESMEHASRVFGEVWDMLATVLDRLKRNWELENPPDAVDRIAADSCRFYRAGTDVSAGTRRGLIIRVVVRHPR